MKGAVLRSVMILAGLLLSAVAGANPPGKPVSALTTTPGPDCGCADTPDARAGVLTALTATSGSLLTTGTASAPAAAIRPEPLEPLFVRLLVQSESGRNDMNPVWSPQGTFISFERSMGDKKEVRIALPNGTPVQTVYHLLSKGGVDAQFFFPGIAEDNSYNAGIAWSPDEQRFIFMSNGGEGNYDLYYLNLGGSAVTRLTDHREKDGQAHWSPNASRVVFVSGRTGSGDVYLLDLAACTLEPLTGGGKPHLYPRWSPDGMKVVFMEGSNENHDIVLIGNIAQPERSRKMLSTWGHDDLRPMWSPDGGKIAFYSNYDPAGDPRVWSIIVVAADGSDPTDGDGLAAKVVATDVLPDVEAGPAWLPDSNRIVYVRNDRREYNPIYVADIRQKTVTPVHTDTRMNHDVACSVDGNIAFRAQVDQWDQIYIMKLAH